MNLTEEQQQRLAVLLRRCELALCEEGIWVGYGSKEAGIQESDKELWEWAADLTPEWDQAFR